MKKTVRFSKDYKGIFNLKTDFYNNNKSNLINANQYRSILVSSKNLNKDIYKKVIGHNIYDVLNEMQECIDKKKISSEVHLVLSK